MNTMLFLVCIGFVVHIVPSNGDSASSEEELLEDLLNAVMDLNTRLDMMSSRLTTLENQLNNASIIPPYSAVNYAICSGRESGISGDATLPSGNADLRCPSGSFEVVGQSGERDGINEILSDYFVSYGIDGCEQRCIETENCVAFNWIIDNNGFNCELYDTAVPTSTYQPDAIVFCALDTAEPCEIGEIIAWSGDMYTLPPRYLMADGSTISASDYPDLCGIIDGECGTGCVLPDLSGRFTVGTGGSSATEVMADLCEVGGDTTLSVGETEVVML